MPYSTPQLLLVGAASGIVLGGLGGDQLVPDHIGCGDPELSRDSIDC
jgi:hypothetical protein